MNTENLQKIRLDGLVLAARIRFELEGLEPRLNKLFMEYDASTKEEHDRLAKLVGVLKARASALEARE